MALRKAGATDNDYTGLSLVMDYADFYGKDWHSTWFGYQDETLDRRGCRAMLLLLFREVRLRGGL